MLYGIDLDMDGVDDSVDKCPNSKITDIVNRYGCVKKKIKFTKKFTKKDAIELQEIVNSIKPLSNEVNKNSEKKKVLQCNVSLTLYHNENTSYILANSVYYGNFNLITSLQFDNKFDDSTLSLALYYQDILFDNFGYIIGAGADFNTNGHEHNTQFISFRLDYYNSFLFSVGYKRVFTHLKSMRNSNFYDFGIGYANDKNSFLLTYTIGDDFYNIDKKTKDLTFSYTYQINYNTYINTQFTKGLSKNRDNSFSVTIGYNY